MSKKVEIYVWSEWEWCMRYRLPCIYEYMQCFVPGVFGIEASCAALVCVIRTMYPCENRNAKKIEFEWQSNCYSTNFDIFSLSVHQRQKCKATHQVIKVTINFYLILQAKSDAMCIESLHHIFRCCCCCCCCTRRISHSIENEIYIFIKLYVIQKDGPFFKRWLNAQSRKKYN